MGTHETLYYRNRSVFNTIAFLVMLTVNILAITLPINGRSTADVAAAYPSLFTPPGFVFASIWTLIYISLLAFTISQQQLAFSNKAEDQEQLHYHMQHMNHWFIISCIFNACWLFAWHYEMIPLSMLLILLLLGSLAFIHRNFRMYNPRAARKEKLFVQLPFSIYLGWITVASLANFATLATYLHWATSHASQIRLSILLVAIATAASCLMVLYRNNIAFGLAGSWALYGIQLKRQQEGLPDEYSIIYACVMGIGLIAISISWHLARRVKSSV